ncbi:hypothetical protein ABW19_dt0206490 [Dactylella cylindrospora]|nr:hypothetical protein ABW19_dt0206490 [Dactylella cylindrospora]
MAQEALKQKEDAIQTYKTLPIPDFNSGVGSSGGEAVYWIRKTLSRFAIASWELFEGVETPDTPKEAHAEDEYDEEEGLDDLDASTAGLRVVEEEDEEDEDAGESPTPAPPLQRPEPKRALSETGLIGAFRAYHAFSLSLSNLRPISVISTATSILTKGPERAVAEDEASRKTIYETYLKVVSKFLKGQIEREEEITEELRSEIMSIEEIYEGLLLKTVKFPHASKINQDVLEWVDTVVDNWATLGARGSDAPRIVEILYRAASKSFHSPRILRHLFTTLTAAGNFHDAQLSLETYITLIKRGKARLEKEKGGAAATSEEDFDSDALILNTCVQGIRFLVKYFDDHAPKAMEIATSIKTWIFEWDVTDHAVLGSVWRGIGLANAAWSHQTVESTQRTEIQERAIAAFKKSLEYEPESYEATFDLAVMLAETRDIDNAVDCVKMVAEAEEKCISAWHLLTLLLTSKGEWDTAMTVSEAIFSLIDENEQMTLGVSAREGLVEIKISQLAIVEMIEGPESAVNLADELLGLYTRLFPGVLTAAGAMTESMVESERSERPLTRGRPTTSGPGAPSIQVTDAAAGASASDPTLARRHQGHQRSGTRGSSLGRNSLRKKRISQQDPLTDDEKSGTKSLPNKLHRTPSQKSAKSAKSGKSVAKSVQRPYSTAEKPISPDKDVASQAIQVNATHSATPSVQSIDRNGGNPHNLPVGSLPPPLRPFIDDRPLLNRPPYLREPVLGEKDERKRVEGVLKRIWLVVAGLYRRAEMFEDARVAVEEAGNVVGSGSKIAEGGVGSGDADVFAERGFLAAAQDLHSDARQYFEIALSYSSDHPLSIVGLCRELLSDEKDLAARDRASGLLQTLTKLGTGWDMSEAWYELAKEHEMSGQTEKAKEVYWWVVKLEDTRGVRGWEAVKPRVL